ncbi:MAG: hypothetical protein CMJ79_02240 [Planctomycetaceae bacterium]|nr:hypothetical protein [Planctomycetaceae bacterium]|tara:strand:- start:758 stop:1210 length:453 start_codon:yes stop_codon:yes gene_type:complete
MPNIFDQADIRFIFPDNWKVIDSHLESQHRRSISLENESSVQWSVYIYSGSENLDELVEETIRAMHMEYEDHEESEPYRQMAGDYELIGSRMYFNFMDFILCITATAIEKDGHSYLFVAEAEDREFDENEAVFGAVAFSLLSPQPSAQTN